MSKQGYIFLDDSFGQHEVFPHHPESRLRLRVMIETFNQGRMRNDWTLVSPREVLRRHLERVHSRALIKKLLEQRERSFQWDDETGGNASSVEAALKASGAAIEAVDLVLAQRGSEAWIWNRPPGHHAERDLAMGFCLCNHAAVAAAYATEELGLKRVLIFDSDVHHGNGTQHIFAHRGDVFYLSIHEKDNFPGTGHEWEIGEDNGRGTTMNLPLSRGAKDPDYLYLMNRLVLPAVEIFNPELVIFSTGFDSLKEDPLGGQELTREGFIQIQMLLVNQLKSANIPYFFLLEGGYHVDAQTETMMGLLQALVGTDTPSTKEEEPRAETLELSDRMLRHPALLY